jgi:MFS family permease
MRDFGTFVVAPFVILYLRSEGMSLATIGILYSLRGTFDVFFSLPIGHLSDKWGRKPWIISSSLSAITAYVLFIVSHSPLQFVIVFVFWNFSDLFWNYSVPMYLHDIVENTGRGDALAKMSVMTTIANVVAPAPAGFLAEVYGVGILFKVALAFEVVIIGTVIYWMRAGLKELTIHQDHEKSYQSLEEKFDIKGILQQVRGKIFYFALAMIFMSFAWAVLEIATPLFLKEELGISYLGFGTVMSATGIIGAVAKIAVGRFTDVHGRRPALLYSTFCASMCMVAVGFAASELQYIITRGTGLIFGALMWIVWMASFHDTVKEKRATLSALIDMLSGITFALGSFSAGFLMSVVSARKCFFLIGAIYLFTVFIFSRIKEVTS